MIKNLLEKIKDFFTIDIDLDIFNEVTYDEICKELYKRNDN
jgi:hypothetical protein